MSFGACDSFTHMAGAEMVPPAQSNARLTEQVPRRSQGGRVREGYCEAQ